MADVPGNLTDLKEKAKSLIGVWIEDKDNENRLLYPYDMMTLDGDIILMCYDIPAGDPSNPATIEDADIYMSEYKEFYRKSRRSGKKAWMKVRAFYDKVFGV